MQRRRFSPAIFHYSRPIWRTIGTVVCTLYIFDAWLQSSLSRSVDRKNASFRMNCVAHSLTYLNAHDTKKTMIIFSSSVGDGTQFGRSRGKTSPPTDYSVLVSQGVFLAFLYYGECSDVCVCVLALCSQPLAASVVDNGEETRENKNET